MAFAKRAADFLADNDSAECGGNNCVALELAQFIGEPSTNVCGDVGVLKQ